MKSPAIIRAAKYMRKVTYKELAQVLNEKESNIKSQILMRAANDGQFNIGTFYRILEALQYVIVCIPKEEYEPGMHHMILDDNTDITVEMFKPNRCPHCGAKLTKKEQSYSGCPYCMSPFVDRLNNLSFAQAWENLEKLKEIKETNTAGLELLNSLNQDDLDMSFLNEEEPVEDVPEANLKIDLSDFDLD